MKKNLLLVAIMVAVIAPAGMAFDVVPVWEHTLIDGGGVLPILVNGDPDPRWDGDPEDGMWDGTNMHDQYDGFIKYDDNRLLLGIRDNGIDETDPAHDAELAAQYPDRSIIWLDANTGAPQGIALHVGFKPVELSAEYESMIDGGAGDPPIADWGDPKDRRFVSGDVSGPEYMNFDIDDEGVLYLGYWYMILRYDPDENGGFTGPTVVYEQDYRDHGGTNRVSQWRFSDINVSGSGADTVVVATGKTWRNGMRTRVFNVDATTNTWTIHGTYGDDKNGSFGNAGGYSNFVNSPDGFEVVYGAGNISGTGAWRYWWDGESFTADEADWFSIFTLEEADGYNHATGGWGDVAAHETLNYFVISSCPSFNGQGKENEDQPGFVTVFSAEEATMGDFVADIAFGSTKERPPVESDELSISNYVVWNGIMTQIKVYPRPDLGENTAEVLYLSQVYGYGKYLVGDEVTPISQWSLF